MNKSLGIFKQFYKRCHLENENYVVAYKRYLKALHTAHVSRRMPISELKGRIYSERRADILDYIKSAWSFMKPVYRMRLVYLRHIYYVGMHYDSGCN